MCDSEDKLLSKGRPKGGADESRFENLQTGEGVGERIVLTLTPLEIDESSDKPHRMLNRVSGQRRPGTSREG